MHTVGHELSLAWAASWAEEGGMMGILWVARGAGEVRGHIVAGGGHGLLGNAQWPGHGSGLGGYQVVMVGIVLCWISLLQVRRANGFGGHGGWWIIGGWWICARGGSQWVRA